MKFKINDKVIVHGLDMAFIVTKYENNEIVRLAIEGEEKNYIVFAKEEVLMLNNYDNARSEGWIM